MPVRFKHDQQPSSFYFVTFTCYKWLSLFHEANAYDAVYKWFDSLSKNNIYVTGYVIMPNHVHALFPSARGSSQPSLAGGETPGIIIMMLINFKNACPIPA
jgi:REP element-mobilizing transposase RayT